MSRIRPAQDPVIELHNVSAGYPGRHVLHDVSLAVTPGELVGIAGPNGTGKTTLLRVVMGLLAPQLGTVNVLGRAIRNWRQRRWVRRQIGYVAQEHVTGPLPITVFDAVLLGRWGRTFSGWHRPGPHDLRAVHEWIGRVGLGDRTQSDVRDLSGGQRQRVALARALVGNPKLLILDEPTTFLDTNSRGQLIHLIKQLHLVLNLTTLLVTHEESILNKVADRVVLLDNGCVGAIRPKHCSARG